MQTHSDDAVPGLPFHECFPPLTSLPLCALDDYSLITWTGKLFPPLCRCCDPTSSSLCYNCLCLKTPSLISSGVSRSADGDVSASCSDSPPDGRLVQRHLSHTRPFASARSADPGNSSLSSGARSGGLSAPTPLSLPLPESRLLFCWSFDQRECPHRRPSLLDAF